MRKVSSQNLVKVICVNFHQNRPNGVEIKCCDGHTHRHTDIQTGLIPDVKVRLPVKKVCKLFTMSYEVLTRDYSVRF